MNIVYVYSRRWPSEKAGLSFSTFTCYGLAKYKEENNIDLMVIKNSNEPANKVLNNYFGLNYMKNLTIHDIPIKSIFSETTRFYIKAFNKIKEMHKKRGVDAVITRTVNFLPYLYLLKKIYGIKVFYEAHSFYLDPGLKKEKGKGRKKEYIYQKLCLPRIDGIICHQNILVDLYKRYLPDQNFCMARTGLKEIIKMDNLYSNKYIGYIGSLYEDKGVKDLFFALKGVEDKTLKLLIVGGRKKRLDEYLSLAKELNVEDRVEITGWVNRKEVDYHLKRIKIGIVPLKDTFHNRYLTSPMKIFNYFSHGIPVIGADLPPVREIITEKGGDFYKIGDVAGLTNIINKLNSSEKLFNRYSNYILNRGKELTWEKRGEKITKFIERV